MSLASELNYATIRALLYSYEDAFGLKMATKKPKVASELRKIDAKIRKRLPDEIRTRNPPSITHDELSELMKWKLGRGKFRPRLQQLAESNSAESVVKISGDAFKKIDAKDLKGAIEDLCAFKGVGPATASLILSLFAPDAAPFMSDEAVHASSTSAGQKIDYTLPRYLEFAAAINKLKSKWNKERKDKQAPPLTAVDIERALWSRAILGPKAASATSKETVESAKDGGASRTPLTEKNKKSSGGKRVREEPAETETDVDGGASGNEKGRKKRKR